jgi:hypothetical protein
MTLRGVGGSIVVLCCVVLCCVVLCCVVLCCVVLYSAVLCCVVLCCVVLCCIVLCCVVLCCAVLYCVVLFGASVVRSPLSSWVRWVRFSLRIHVERASQRSVGENRGCSGFLPQGKLAGWVRINRVKKVISQLL